ncbi:TPR-like protein [Athelia psychrophila]|uniref:TPR-like protein n=1 Tax=Athelia psychrophila TaxID=1759441 RepID=A0A166MYN3_9AGAM|nr:TPR-like protein [Fibularhizoctonia sp. CBS 109695]
MRVHMHQTDRALRVQAFTEGHPLPSFNDAAVDLISSCFTGRHEDVQYIADAFASPTGSSPARYAIWGMPGLGKSQLGLKYAHLSFESGRHTHIFAISATTVDKLTKGLTGVLELVQHPARHNPDQAVQLKAARHCFEHSEKYGFVKWLILFDNATSQTVAFLRQHLPRQNSNGSILITTRTLEIAEALTNVAGQQHPIRELKALSPVQSAELLLKKAGIPSNTALDLECAQKLVERMGCLPLAVEQAGALMKQNGFSSADRLNNLYDHYGSGEIIGWTNSLTNYEETSVLAAFTAPLQRLGANNPDVLSFLRVMACLDPENIPLDILVLGAKRTRRHLASNTESTLAGSPRPHKKPFGFGRLIAKLPGKQATPRPLVVLPSVEVPLELIPLLDSICSEEWLRGACGHLKDLSLARPLYGEKPSLHIHDLIRQVVIKQTPAAHDSLEKPYHALAVTLLSQAFPTIDDVRSPQSWTQCERVVPHLMALVKHVGTSPVDLLEVLSVHVARYFEQRGRYKEAAALCQHALEGQTQRLGADHPDTLTTVDHLADVYERQGMYNEAEVLYRQALAGREQQLGGTHPDTLSTVNNFAWLYQNQGQYIKAELLYRRALAGQTQQLGLDHRDTLRTVHRLAGLYYQQGKHDEAAAFYQRALAGRERQLGAEHPDTLGAVEGLAIVYSQQRKYHETEALYRRALAGKEQQLGADHPDTLATVYNLAGLYHQQGNYVEAEGLYQRALAGCEQQLGADHPSALTAIYSIALLYRNQGKYDKAETLYKRALAGQETSLGIHHPSAIITMKDRLADVYVRQGRYDDAEASYQRALAGREQQLGADHRATLNTVNGLAIRALTGREKQLGADHPDTLGTVHYLATLYDQQGKYLKAEALYKRALAGRDQQLGAHHPDTLTTVDNLAGLYSDQGNNVEAEALYQRALAGKEQQLGPDHPETLMTVHNIAVLYENQGKYDEAETLYQRALAGRETSLGIHHPDTIRTMRCLADVYDAQGRDDEANTLRVRAEEADKVRSSK